MQENQKKAGGKQQKGEFLNITVGIECTHILTLTFEQHINHFCFTSYNSIFTSSHLMLMSFIPQASYCAFKKEGVYHIWLFEDVFMRMSVAMHERINLNCVHVCAYTRVMNTVPTFGGGPTAGPDPHI